ncbi:MAG: hypothetical protein ABIH25_00145 [Candidatus Woesearchaeota archaeon]
MVNLTLTAIFPTLQLAEIDWENIRKVRELENRLNARAQESHYKRLDRAIQSGNLEAIERVSLENVHKYFLKPCSFKYR